MATGDSLNDLAERVGARAGIAVAERFLAELAAGRLVPPPEWLDLKQAANHVGVSEPFLCTLIKQGKGPRSIKRGNHRRIRREWLDAWLLESDEGAVGA